MPQRKKLVKKGKGGVKMSGKTDDVIYERTFCTLTRILGGKQCVITCL
mgnify:CR=1 FL=1